MSSVGIMASGVAVSSGVDVLFEDFENLTDAPWTTIGGTPTTVAARTGNGARVGGTGGVIGHALGANESTDVLVGFAVLPQISSSSQRTLLELRGDAGATRHVRVLLDGTSGGTAGRITVSRDVTGLGSSAAGVLVLDTWAYVEARVVLSDTLGSVVVRVNGAAVLTLTGVDTRNAGTDGLIDQVRVGASAAGLFNVYDDLYIATNGAPYKGDITV